MIGNLINSAGGRGFVFALLAALFTAAYVIFDDMTWAQWISYNTAIGLAFLGSKAVEGAADAIAGKKGNGGSG
jgi:hypothetical protein